MPDLPWFKMHTKLLRSPVWRNSSPAHKAVVVTILNNANHHEQSWWDEEAGKEITLPPGSFTTSYRTLAEDAEVSLGAVRNALKRLQSQNFCTAQAHHNYTLIHVTHWTYYQANGSNNTHHNTRDSTRDEREMNARRTRGERNRDVLEVQSTEYVPPRAREDSDKIPEYIQTLAFDTYGHLPTDLPQWWRMYCQAHVPKAIKATADAGKDSPKYTKAILERWRKEGCDYDEPQQQEEIQFGLEVDDA